MNRLYRVLALVAFVSTPAICSFFMGCNVPVYGSAGGPVVVTVPAIPAVPQVPTGAHARAIVAGLTAVNPASYGGWAGACPGCDIDAMAMSDLLWDRGIPVLLMTNNMATIAGMLAAATLATQGLESGDLLVVYVSGHGGQVKDASGDEPDGMDETICLWDGQLSDDVVWEMLVKIPAGVRVFFVTDTCNSGTNYRSVHQYEKPWYRLFSTFKGSMLHFGGCADGEASFGSAKRGGAFTASLIAAWKDGASYKQWFEAAKALMEPGQKPTMAEEGLSFSDTEALKCDQ